MKNLTLGLALVLTLISQVSFASLKSEMKESGNILKQIAGSVNNPAKNQANAAATAQIITLFEASRTKSPGSMGSGSFADYQALMDQTIAHLKELQSAFLSNDNAGALSALQKINTIKKEGHDKYK